jgi:hypothetical protein
VDGKLISAIRINRTGIKIEIPDRLKKIGWGIPQKLRRVKKNWL